MPNHYLPLIRQLVGVADDLSRQVNKLKEIDQIQATCRLLESLPCEHMPKETVQPGARTSRCGHCGRALILAWVLEPVEEDRPEVGQRLIDAMPTGLRIEG